MTNKDIKKAIEQTLAGRPYILRTDPLRRQLDGLSPAVMANMDSDGTGPERLIYVGRKAAYETSAYIDWLANRVSTQKERGA
jgi:hypothetical protein